MINKLKQLFPSLQVLSSYDHLREEYNWYMTDQGEFIRIKKSEMTEKDEALLSAFLQQLEDVFPPKSNEEQLWYERIFKQKSVEKEVGISPYRFVYFQIDGDIGEPLVFKNALTEIFSRDIPLLWKNTQEGIIIEEQNGELIDYNQIIDLLMSDLYVKMKFYVGRVRTSLKQIDNYHKTIERTAKLGMKFVKKPVFSYIDVVPYLLIHSTEESVKQEISETLLKDVKEDKETLKMIETFINCNLNISLTAKQLYLHRNSLQYRLDKFIEQTNIDIREFHNALAVYFALIILNEDL